MHQVERIPASVADKASIDADELGRLIEHAAHLLPAQGPIAVFVHHNTLHAFEDVPFAEGVKEGARVFVGEPYLSEDRYRELLVQGRIRLDDLSAVLKEDLRLEGDAPLGSFGTRFDLRLAMLRRALREPPTSSMRWLAAESDALRQFSDQTPPEVRQRALTETRHWAMRDLRDARRPAGDACERAVREIVAALMESFGTSSIDAWDDATWESFYLHLLWRICRRGVQGAESPPAAPPSSPRPRDALHEATKVDSDRLVDEVLQRFCAAFLDQGMAHWTLPCRDEGFFRAFCALYRGGGGPPDRWLRGLRAELARLEESGLGPLGSIRESLETLGIGAHERDEFLSATLLALRGWAGMIWQTETRGDRVAKKSPPGSLIEYLAIRLILERLALTHVALRALHYDGPLCGLRQAARSRTVEGNATTSERRAFLVFQLAQVLGWMPADLYRLTGREWSVCVAEIERFSSVERRRVYHLAYERRYRVQVLDAISVQARGKPARVSAPRFQIVCCIDDREESLRRHLEEVEPECETFGAAGFFSAAMYYRGAADAHFTPLCPIVMRPRHWVDEVAAYTFDESHRRRIRTRRLLGAAARRLHLGSRTFAIGAVLAALIGPLASLPLIARVLFPRLTARLRRMATQVIRPPRATQLRLERAADADRGPAEGQLGFTVAEMADVVGRLLQDIGLTAEFARVVVIAGHGSASLNNPHESAYNCGACAGARGGPNARAFAQMANDARVRDLLASRDILLPPHVVFVGAFHDTCNDSVTYFDLDRLPPSHFADFDRARQAIEQARERNAHERCRRFESAPLDLSTEAALRHVEARAEDLAQTRPEYNHATNAVCIVGRRARNRGLFLDRRAFLTSYDPDRDDDRRSVLTRILQAVVPVCAGISLEYYFSCVDPVCWGCSTKLPHNVTSLLGVMDGAASDLRTGLSSQMTEIHEPLRLVLLVESTPDALSKIMEANPLIASLCRHDWVQTATLDPNSSQIHVLHDGRFELYRPETDSLPRVAGSIDWYRGWRDHLGFAIVEDALPRGSDTGE